MPKPTIMPAIAPAAVVRFHQMPSTSGANRPAAASENAHATIWMIPAGRVPATAAATRATPTSSKRARQAPGRDQAGYDVRQTRDFGHRQDDDVLVDDELGQLQDTVVVAVL